MKDDFEPLPIDFEVNFEGMEDLLVHLINSLSNGDDNGHLHHIGRIAPWKLTPPSTLPSVSAGGYWGQRAGHAAREWAEAQQRIRAKVAAQYQASRDQERAAFQAQVRTRSQAAEKLKPKEAAPATNSKADDTITKN